MKALHGIKSSYRLQQVLHRNNPLEPIRGFRQTDEGTFVAHNGFLYSVLRSNRSHRRGLLTSLLNLFDDTGVRKQFSYYNHSSLPPGDLFNLYILFSFYY